MTKPQSVEVSSAATPPKPRCVVVLGSGALQIGQAGEFDYSGSQALQALREEGIRTVLVNPNIATVQTSPELASALYLLPIEPSFVERVIAQEGADAILLGFGGQSALNCGLALADSGVLAARGVRVLGTSIEAIRACEDRQLFADRLAEIGLGLARGRTVTTAAEAQQAAREIGFPLVLRAGFSLGGRGSAIVRGESELAAAIEHALRGVPQVLLEECLSGWKELEYELVRDADDNCIAVCNIENVDPMGVHTGESVVVAPSQTLSDDDHQRLRDAALRAIRHLGIVGECNIQFALDPRSDRFVVIEVNPRLSRSSALASKATGYPLAFVAAKLALGYTLPALRNAITKTTTACFEPALDYVVCKVPRWDVDKFEGADRRIGTEMKSVGEVMAIGRSFGEALQKALRMIDVGADGFDPALLGLRTADEARAALAAPTTQRIFALAAALKLGLSVEEITALTAIDPFFLREMEGLIVQRAALASFAGRNFPEEILRAAKQSGFSDAAIARAAGTTEAAVRAQRHALGIVPRLRQIDTLAGEYPAQTNYLYLTYNASEDDTDGTEPGATAKRLLLLGSGCYRIGSSVEFDFCCVTAAQTARQLGYSVTLLNCNPETVSTDYHLCDRLIFDEVSLEVVLDLWVREGAREAAGGAGFVGVLGAMGGQTPNRLALPLARAGVHLLGTPADSIDRAEDRARFSALCDELGIDQPRWSVATERADLEAVVKRLGGYPVLVRPSYVLSGAAMRVAHSAPELLRFLDGAARVSPAHPVVISKFERHAREIELDAVAQGGVILAQAISQHIEEAGVHSGDATLVLPPLDLPLEILRKVRRIGAQLARALDVTGPFNVQLLARDGAVKVIECNLRASRSFPFVTRASGQDLIRAATRVMLGAEAELKPAPDLFDLDYVAVKAPMFSFRRLVGADPLLGVEMASTGEVGCFGRTREEALAQALLSTGFRFPRRGVLLSLGPVGDKYRFTDEAQALAELGLQLYATAGTAEILHAEGVPCVAVDKGERGDASAALQLIKSGAADLVIHLPRTYDEHGRPDGFRVRRAAIDHDTPLITDLELARAVVHVLRHFRTPELAMLLPARSYAEYVAKGP
ncbi:MAG: carbamoyl-phosphate synthase (glutamine-hydrolyzing) large subunit [Polyangia bacterium]